MKKFITVCKEFEKLFVQETAETSVEESSLIILDALITKIIANLPMDPEVRHNLIIFLHNVSKSFKFTNNKHGEQEPMKRTLRVVLEQDLGNWIATAVDIYFSTVGNSMEDVQKRFESNLLIVQEMKTEDQGRYTAFNRSLIKQHPEIKFDPDNWVAVGYQELTSPPWPPEFPFSMIDYFMKRCPNSSKKTTPINRNRILHVTLEKQENEQGWIAQARELDYVAAGDSIKDVISRFECGLMDTVTALVSCVGHLKHLNISTDTYLDPKDWKFLAEQEITFSPWPQEFPFSIIEYYSKNEHKTTQRDVNVCFLHDELICLLKSIGFVEYTPDLYGWGGIITVRFVENAPNCHERNYEIQKGWGDGDPAYARDCEINLSHFIRWLIDRIVLEHTRLLNDG